jgi:hypothetical protein
MKMFENKKAQLIGTSMALMVTSAIIIALLVVFFLFISVMPSGKAKAVSSDSLKMQVSDSLIAYLESPVSVDGQDIKISELIRLAKTNSRYKDILKEASEGIFDKVYGEDYHLWTTYDDKVMFEVNPFATTKYGWIQTKLELPEKTAVYLQLARGKNE